MPKGKVVFIVEGDLERTFLQRHCNERNIIVRKIPSNGDSISTDCIAKMVNAILATIRNPGYVFVILDREGRAETSESLELEILPKLSKANSISVHIADRMIENWILADTSALQAENLNVVLPNGSEGSGGKAKLKAAFKANRDTYSETVDGVRLLGRCSPQTIAGHSPSFLRLYTVLNAEAAFCSWLH